MTTATHRITRSAAIAALLLTGVLGAAQADDYRTLPARASRPHFQADGNLVDVGIRVDGQNAPMFWKPGRFDRHYFQAHKGKNYAIVLRNNTGRRVGVLIAVDGLNVVNGELSGLSHNEPMYVLDAHEEAVIRGWRTSLSDVRRFVFVDEERSYAERTNQSNGDLGWIRVHAFREVQPWLGWDTRKFKDDLGRNRSEYRGSRPEGKAQESEQRMDAAPPSAESRAQLEGSRDESGNPGTGWGEKRHDPVRQTEFRAERNAIDQIVMRYEYLSGLRALGIFPSRNRTWDRDNGNLGFAQPPKW
jgi:hypothetical protein